MSKRNRDDEHKMEYHKIELGPIKQMLTICIMHAEQHCAKFSAFL